MRIAFLSKLTDVSEPEKQGFLSALEQTLLNAGHESHCLALPFDFKNQKEFTESSLSIKFLSFMNIDRLVVLEPALMQVTHPHKIGLFFAGNYERLQISKGEFTPGITNTKSIVEILFSAPDFNECKRIICSQNDTTLGDSLRNCASDVVQIQISCDEISKEQMTEICHAIVA